MRKFHNRKMLAAATIMSCMMASQVIAAPAYNQSGKSNQATTGAITWGADVDGWYFLREICFLGEKKWDLYENLSFAF